MELGGHAAEGEPEPAAGARRAPGGLALHEAGEDALAQRRWHAWPLVGDPKLERSPVGARFDRDGRPSGGPVHVNAAWPIADVAWMPVEHQYYFLLYYGGGDPRGTRLCGVHIGEQNLTNVEHPYWVSRPGMIDEARLVVNGSRVFAVYRDDSQVFETEVTNGSWGQDPAAAPRSHGRAGANVAYSLRAAGDGIEVRLRPLGD